MRRRILAGAVALGAVLAAAGLPAVSAQPAPGRLYAPAARPAPGSAGRGAVGVADTLRVEASVSPGVVKVGERVHVRFAVARPDSTARLIAPPAPSGFGDLDVVESTPAAAGDDSLGWRLEVALFRPGDYDLGVIPVSLESAAGSRPVRLLPYTVSVESTLPDTLAGAGIHDIAGPVDVPAHWRRGAIIAAVLALAALAAAAIAWTRRKREVEPVRIRVPDVSPETEARRALSALERDALPARGLIKEHYARLSLILRAYLERRTPLAAVESTTDEIRIGLAGRSWPAETSVRELLDLFEEADLVKFARFDPGRETAEGALVRGRAWIEAAAPVFAARDEAPPRPAAAAAGEAG